MRNNQKNPKSDEIFDGFETGVVKNLEGEYAIITLQESDACEHCHAQVICKPSQGDQRQVKLKNNIQAQIGDQVLLESSDKEHIKLTFMQYGIPLLGFFLGLLLSNKYVAQFPFALSREIGSFLSGLIGMGLGSLLTYFWSKHRQDDFSVLKMRKIVSSNRLKN